MTRTEQANRRVAILKAVVGGETRTAVAHRLNVARDTVDKACQGQGLLSLRANNERLWLARHLHRRVVALAKRRGESQLDATNRVIRDGLKVDAGMREIERLTKARRDGR